MCVLFSHMGYYIGKLIENAVYFLIKWLLLHPWCTPSIFVGVPVSYFMAFLNNFLSFAWKQKEIEFFLNSPCIFSGSLSPSILCTYQHQEWLQGKTYIEDGNIFVFVITYNNNKDSLEFLSSSIPHCNALVRHYKHFFPLMSISKNVPETVDLLNQSGLLGGKEFFWVLQWHYDNWKI